MRTWSLLLQADDPCLAPTEIVRDMSACGTKPLGQLVVLLHQSSAKGSQWHFSLLRQVVTVSQIGASWWEVFQEKQW